MNRMNHTSPNSLSIVDKGSTNHPEPVLSVAGLTVSFGINGINHVAVDSVSWDAYPGEVLALVGESGSGKSATALAVAGLLPHSATARGSVRFRERNLLDLSEDRMRDIRGQRIAMIFQDPLNALDPVFTIGSQITELLRVHNPRLNKSQAKAKALELMRSVNMPDPELKLTQYPHQLSGGQCQRVMIAMALSSKPDVLLADEPTTALDVTVQQSVLDLLRDIADRTNTAIVLITHDMGVVADIADRVIVMRSGRIVETAAVRPLFAAPEDPYTQDLLSAVPGRAQAHQKSPVDDSSTPLLAVENLVVEYSTRALGKKRTLRAVDDVSFDIRPGEVFGLVGESGSGKSTIGKALVGLAPISNGAVRIGDVRIGKGTRRDLRRARHRIGFVFQNPTASLDPRRSIGDAINEPLALLGRLHGTALAQRRTELLESVDLPSKWADRYPHELSGGQRQRVAIARALSLRPELIIADEPTSALDVSVQATVLELLARLQAEHDFACVFISHDLAVVGQMCHRVAVLQAGQIVEQGTTEQVLTQPQAGFARQLLEAAPIPDPVEQSRRRTERRMMNSL